MKREVADLVNENARVAQDQDDYVTRHNLLVEQYMAFKLELEGVEAEIAGRIAKREGILRCLAELEQNGPLNEFDEAVWYATVEKVTVGTDGGMTFMFRDGSVL